MYCPYKCVHLARQAASVLTIGTVTHCESIRRAYRQHAKSDNRGCSHFMTTEGHHMHVLHIMGKNVVPNPHTWEHKNPRRDIRNEPMHRTRTCSAKPGCRHDWIRSYSRCSKWGGHLHEIWGTQNVGTLRDVRGGYTKVLDVGITKAEKPRKHADWTEEATVADQQITNTKTTCGWQYHSRVCGLQSQNAHTAQQT